MAKLHLHFKRMINYAFNRNAQEFCCCCTLVMHPVNEKHWKTKLWRKTRFHVAFYRRREKIIQLSKRKYWRATKSYWTTFYATKSHLGEKTNFVERLIHLSAEAFLLLQNGDLPFSFNKLHEIGSWTTKKCVVTVCSQFFSLQYSEVQSAPNIVSSVRPVQIFI